VLYRDCRQEGLCGVMPQIRRAEEGDAEELTQLARRAKASWGYSETWQREWESALSFSTEYIRLEEVFVAESKGTLLGIVAVRDDPTTGPEIDHLWVLPESQGRGVGRLLLKQAVQMAKERGWASLRIESDPNAQPFYERMGATKVGDVSAPVAGVERSLPVLRLPI